MHSRTQKAIRWIALALIMLSILVIISTLPMHEAIGAAAEHVGAAPATGFLYGLVAMLLIAALLAAIGATRSIRYGSQACATDGTDSTTPLREADVKQSATHCCSARTWLMAVLAVGSIGAAAYAYTHVPQMHRAVVELFGPAAVDMQESHDAPGDAFDHSLFDKLLAEYVDADGWVDYRGISEESGQLDAYIARIGAADYAALGRADKLAFLINAYNAFTLRLILDHFHDDAFESIKDIPKQQRWLDERWEIDGTSVSLNQIEHEQIRPNFAEPRVHWALVCAAYSCPKLRNEAYTADKLEEQLEDQAALTHQGERWFHYDVEHNIVQLTKLYDWYAKDFEQFAPSVLAYASQYTPALKVALDAKRSPSVKWIEYDWRLNDISNRPATAPRE